MKLDAASRLPICLEVPPTIRFLSQGRFAPESHPSYRLPTLWAMHLYTYEAQIRYENGPWLPIRPGMVGFTPPDTGTTYRWHQGDSVHLCAHFALPEAEDGGHTVPLMAELGGDFRPVQDTMVTAMEYLSVTPRRAQAELWALLWRLHAVGHPAGAGQHPALARAFGYVERNLAEPIQVRDIVRAAGISHNHLTRLCRERTGLTLIAYLRHRRAERARRLLRETTLPVKVIALNVGIADLQQFNKLVRSATGKSPRELRRKR